LYVDDKGTVVWGKESLEELFSNPRDSTYMMNSDATVVPTQIILGEGCHTWELVRSAEQPNGTVVIKSGKDEQVDTAKLVPNSLHDLRPEGIGTLLGVRRGKKGFESIETGKPICVTRLTASANP
jgi:hypothetical protein